MIICRRSFCCHRRRSGWTTCTTWITGPALSADATVQKSSPFRRWSATRRSGPTGWRRKTNMRCATEIHGSRRRKVSELYRHRTQEEMIPCGSWPKPGLTRKSAGTQVAFRRFERWQDRCGRQGHVVTPLPDGRLRGIAALPDREYPPHP